MMYFSIIINNPKTILQKNKWDQEPVPGTLVDKHHKQHPEELM